MSDAVIKFIWTLCIGAFCFTVLSLTTCQMHNTYHARKMIEAGADPIEVNYLINADDDLVPVAIRLLKSQAKTE